MKKILTLLALLLMPIQAYGALTLPAGSGSAGVNFSNPSTLNNLDPFTVIMWVYPTGSFATNQRIYIKGGSILRFQLLNTSSPVDLRIRRDRNGGADDYRTSSGPLVQNKWNFIAVTYNSAGSSGQRINVYSGDLSTKATEASYASQTDGTGTLFDDSGNALIIGAEDAINNFSMGGHYAFITVLAEELSLNQIRAMQFRPMIRSTTRLYSHLGFNSTTNVTDWSGKRNTGTITGGSLWRHVPLGNLFGR